MLATDNHIGYMERDPIRGQDSINTFKEILQLAVKHDVSVWSLYSFIYSLSFHNALFLLKQSLPFVVADQTRSISFS